MNNELLAAITAIAIICSVMVVAIAGLGRGIAELCVPGELAQIEQLREDVKRVGVASSEDVIGQVTQWNQDIKANQRYRKIWWGRLLTPEEWEGVECIEIP